MIKCFTDKDIQRACRVTGDYIYLLCCVYLIRRIPEDQSVTVVDSL